MPKYKGGERAMLDFIKNNAVYPKWEFENDIQGKVEVEFIVEKDCNVSNIKTNYEIENGENLANEAARVVGLLWFESPAKVNFIPARITMKMPITFSIRNNTKELN